MVSAAYFERAFTNKRPNSPHGGFRLPRAEAGPFHFEPPRNFSACKAETLGDATDGCPSDAGKIFVRLQLFWGHASAQQLKRVFAGTGGGSVKWIWLLKWMGFRGSVKCFAPPIKLRMRLLWAPPLCQCSMRNCRCVLFFLEGLIALRAIGVFSEYSLLVLLGPY